MNDNTHTTRTDNHHQEKIMSEFDATTSNTTTKENTTMKCHAITAKKSACKGNGCHTVTVLTDRINAVHAESVNPNNFAGWLQHSLTFCGVHKQQLETGRTINIQSITKEDTMPTRPITTQEELNDANAQGANIRTQEELNEYNRRIHRSIDEPKGYNPKFQGMDDDELIDHAADLHEAMVEIHAGRSAYDSDTEWEAELTPVMKELEEAERELERRERKNMPYACGHCHKRHATKGEVKTCGRKARITKNGMKLVSNENKGFVCGNCSYWEDGKKVEKYHDTLDAVKACFAGRR